MTNQIVSIVEILALNDIFREVKSIFSFKLINFVNTQDFLNKVNDKDPDTLSSVIISNTNNNLLLSSKIIDLKNLILIENSPIRINQLVDKINILLIKKKYSFQSKLKIKNYTINLNSKEIFNQETKLKLTEREIDIILFLKEKDSPQSVDNLQNEVWNYSSILETHTVETHVYRLRKKFKNHFNDDNFILSLKEGYKI